MSLLERIRRAAEWIKGHPKTIILVTIFSGSLSVLSFMANLDGAMNLVRRIGDTFSYKFQKNRSVKIGMPEPSPSSSALKIAAPSFSPSPSPTVDSVIDLEVTEIRKAQSLTRINSPLLKMSATELLAELSGSVAPEDEKLVRSPLGMKIEWDLPFSSVTLDGYPGSTSAVFMSSRSLQDYPRPVFCKLPLSEYDRLSSIPKWTILHISGVISEIGSKISLSDSIVTVSKKK